MEPVARNILENACLGRSVHSFSFIQAWSSSASSPGEDTARGNGHTIYLEMLRLMRLIYFFVISHVPCLYLHLEWTWQPCAVATVSCPWSRVWAPSLQFRLQALFQQSTIAIITVLREAPS